MKDILEIFDDCHSLEDMDKAVHGVVMDRQKNGKMLAKKFPELKGLSWKKFIEKLPMGLDFITANEMFKALTPKKRKEK